jgi:transketolase
MVSRALQAARSLAIEGIQARVLNVAFVEPLDTEAVLEAAAQTRGIVTAEEATITGGLGAAVAVLTAQQRPTRLRILGVPRSFAPTGSTEFLLEHFGLTADHIAAAARDIMTHAVR